MTSKLTRERLEEWVAQLDEIMAHALKCAGVHTWRYENA